MEEDERMRCEAEKRLREEEDLRKQEAAASAVAVAVAQPVGDLEQGGGKDSSRSGMQTPKSPVSHSGFLRA